MDDDVLGFVDYLAVEWPGGYMTGEELDLEFIAKAGDGTVTKVALGDVEHGGEVDVTMWDGASSGLLD